ncbi:MAG: hypothetical protein ACE5EV_06540, partial [Gaiellales bacterium]
GPGRGVGWRGEGGRAAPAAADPLLLATDEAERLVDAGTPFRDAHRAVAATVRDGSFTPSGSPGDSVARRPAPGPASTGAAIAAARARLAARDAPSAGSL